MTARKSFVEATPPRSFGANALEPVISIEGLGKVWPDGTLGIEDVSLEVPAGEIVAILGGSGAGKSTLLRAAARLVEPTAGRVRIGDRDLEAARGRALARARAAIGFVFQQFNLIGSYTVLANVLTARISHVSYWRGLVGRFGAADRAIALRCLADVGMRDKAQSLARDLSGGQQQRVAIARAFAQEPRALFADEPTASLDPKLSETVLALLHGYCKSKRVPALINVHTIEHARRYADRVIGLRRGRLVHDGPAAALDQAALDAIYGTGDEAA
ncbi:MAG: phosphonate ABC transporter ATP-binding protein [Polyangia bacterium]